MLRGWTIPVLDFDGNDGQFTRGILDSLRRAERIRISQHVGHPNAEGIRRLAYASDTVATTANDIVGAYVLHFIDYAVHGRAAASAFLDRAPEDNGIPTDLISIRRERGEDVSPGPRGGALMVYDAARAQTLLFGGQAPSVSGSGMTYPNDLWAWNGTRWRRLEPPAGTPRPAGREVPHLVYDAARQRVLMFGGRRRPEILSDMWEWDGTRWHELTDTGYETVTHAATVFNPARGRVMMFGGGRVAPATGMSRTLWEWDGGRWNAVDTAGPANTIGMEIAVKPGGEMILLARGPFQDAAPASRTWTWNGSWRQGEIGPVIASLQATTGTPDGTMYIYRSWERWLTAPIMMRRDPNGVWTQIPSDAGPGLRYTEAAAWDSARGRMVIYGGTNTRGTYLTDTWEFDGRTWIHR
jgi:hypothetical protein